MNVSLAVPDDIARQLNNKWTDVSRQALEALAVEAYRSGVLTTAEVQRMLNLPSRWETDEFLKQKQAYLVYTENDLQQDINAIRQLSAP